MRRPVALMLVTLGSLMVVPAALASTTITVSSFSDTDTEGAAGCSDAGGSVSCPSLRDAIGYANGHFASGGATIELKAGTYTVTNGFDGLVLDAPDSIVGAGDTGSGATIIQDSIPGTAAMSLEQGGGTASLSQLELTGGLFGLDLNPASDDSTFDVDQVNVTGNTDTGASPTTAGVGGGEALSGGIYYAGTPGSAMNLTDSLVQNNIVKGGSGASFGSGPCPGFGADDGGSAFGGGLYLGGDGKVTVTGTRITGNTVTGGDGSPASEACPGGVGGDAVGGGVFIGPNPGPLSVVIQQSTIAENTASSGQDGVGEVVASGSPTAFGGGIADGLTSAANSGPITGVALTVESSTINDNNVIGVAEPKVGSSNQPAALSYGGAIAAANGAAVIGVNSTLFDNVASANGTPPSTATGNAFGGALYAVSGTTSVDFASTTVYDNIAQASSAAHEFGGSFDGALDAAFTFADTVVADAGPSGVANCKLTSGSSITDSGYNLEDDGAKSCDFTKATDKVTSAMLPSSLGDNGGSTETLLPLAGSPVIGGGGACFDPTAANPGTPLTTDQRGEPRSSSCDIGAVQVQQTANTAPPTLSGTASVGHLLTCNRGTWSGDGLSYGYEWLRGGSAIAGAVSSTYTVQGTDLGTSISCQVTATGLAGNASASSAADSVSSTTGSTLTLSGVGQLHAKWRESGKPSKRKPPVGTAFRMHLSAAARVTFRFEQTARGRRSGRRCVAATRKNHKLKSCSLTIARGTVVASERAGEDSLAFSGKPAHGGRLRPGKYEVVIQAVGANGKPSASFTLRFTIVK
jgi:hypothetical protein